MGTYPLSVNSTGQVAGYYIDNQNVRHGFVAKNVDLNGDGHVDIDDIQIILNALNTPATGFGDPRDIDGDQKITILDARKEVFFCDQTRCARP